MPSDIILNREGGGRIIHRSRRVAKCDFCQNEHRFLCDWHDGDSPKTCDKKLCGVCTTRVGAGDFCPVHAQKP